MKLMSHYYLDQILEIITPFASLIFIKKGDEQFVILLWFFVESFTIKKFTETTKHLEIISRTMLSGEKKFRLGIILNLLVNL